MVYSRTNGFHGHGPTAHLFHFKDVSLVQWYVPQDPVSVDQTFYGSLEVLAENYHQILWERKSKSIPRMFLFQSRQITVPSRVEEVILASTAWLVS